MCMWLLMYVLQPEQFAYRSFVLTARHPELVIVVIVRYMHNEVD